MMTFLADDFLHQIHLTFPLKDLLFYVYELGILTKNTEDACMQNEGVTFAGLP